ncbi:MAG: hypothetical protein MZU91_07890 [Desulfosudis oleivorans]|nr:hypothetical protein [Desulfosudis oleivorans]
MRETVFQGETYQGAQRRHGHDFLERCPHRHQRHDRRTASGRWARGCRPRCRSTSSARASCGRTGPLSSATGTSRPTGRSRTSPASGSACSTSGCWRRSTTDIRRADAHGVHPDHRGGHAARRRRWATSSPTGSPPRSSA